MIEEADLNKDGKVNLNISLQYRHCLNRFPLDRLQ